jgi:hypothetical protein
MADRLLLLEIEMTEPLRAALFIDFDNVYLSLKQIDARAANTFAQRPAMWLDWLEAGRHDAGERKHPRRVLVRNCYLNPAAFHQQRAFFTRAAFNVIDCPALTARGKNSADIVMAMDILDGIQHSTRFDEFIILSSDADFTPVLLRLRENDRLTAVLTSAVTAAAFREACDTSIDLETFAVEALGLDADDYRRRQPTQEGNHRPQAVSYANDIDEAARRLMEETRRNTEIPSQEIFKVFTKMQRFQGSYWFGMGSLKALLDKIIEKQPDLIVEMDGSLPALVRLRGDADPKSTYISQLPPSRNPANHNPNEQEFRGDGTPEPRFVDDVYMLIGAPRLSGTRYRRLFEVLSQASADELLLAAAAPLPKGAGVSRRDASFVISSLSDSGENPLDGDEYDLAERFLRSIEQALINAGHPPSESDKAILENWILGPEDEDDVVE